jgi:hypothetical protein
MGNGFEKVRYFIQRNDAQMSDLRVARLPDAAPRRGLVANALLGLARRERHEEVDIVRRYWNGFDADVDEITDEEALAAIKLVVGRPAGACRAVGPEKVFCACLRPGAVAVSDLQISAGWRRINEST